MNQAFFFFLSQITACIENWIQKQTERLFFLQNFTARCSFPQTHEHCHYQDEEKKKKRLIRPLVPCSDWIVAPYATGILS